MVEIGKSGIDVESKDLKLPQNSLANNSYYCYHKDNLEKKLAFKSESNYVLVVKGTIGRRTVKYFGLEEYKKYDSYI